MQHMLAENDWIFLLQLIYRLNRIDDFSTFCLTFLQQIKILIPHTESRAYRMKRKAGEHYPYARICCSCGANTFSNDFDVSKYEYFWAEYLYTPWSNVFRHSDIVNSKEFEETELYKNVYVPQNMHHAIKTVLIQDDHLLGVFALFRPKTDVDFSSQDVYVLNLLKDHLALRFSQLSGESGIVLSNSSQHTKLHKISDQFNLTKRECEILGMIINDTDENDICNKLCISSSTLKKHISNIYQKTDVSNRIQLHRLVNSSDI